jgi:hypothetical protein
LKKRNVSRLILIILLTTAFTQSSTIASAEDVQQQLDFNVVAEGGGLVIWGFSWMPPYPGESFYLGGPGPDPPVVPFPMYNWGNPTYSAKLENSVIKIAGDSNLEEAPVRTDSPEALPTDLTKFWLRSQNSTGILKASWVEAGGTPHKLEIDISSVNSGGVWVGPPATCPWGHLALGFISPSVPIQPMVFEGYLDNQSINGRMQVISWPDTMMANLWIDDGVSGTYVNIIWVDPDAYMTHEWLTHWLAFEIELPEFGYEPGDDPLAAWVPTAEVLSRELKVGDIVILQSNARYWSDDFTDRDYDGWTITGYNFEPFYVDMMTPPIPIQGNYSAEDGTLLSLGPRVPGLAGVASHPSTVAYGTWSFDIHITDETEEHFYIYFATDEWGDYPLHINSYDIAIVLQPGQAWSWELEEDAQSGFVLVKRNGAATEGGWQGLGSYSLYEELSGVYHIDITRDHNGNFKVYIDGDLVIEAKDNEHTTSTWFRFTGEPGPAIDNVVVKDTIDDLAQQLDEKVLTLQNEVSGLESEMTSLENEKSALEAETETLEDEKATLEDEKSTLTTEKAALEGTVSTLQENVSSLEGSLGSWQMYTAAALIIGLIIGAAAIYMTKR